MTGFDTETQEALSVRVHRLIYNTNLNGKLDGNLQYFGVHQIPRDYTF